MSVSYPLLYQLNTRVYLTELSHRLGRPATLDDLPDELFHGLRETGFHWIWLLSVWQTTPAAREVSRSDPGWRTEFQHTLPDLSDQDIDGSGFAIADYVVAEHLGGDQALTRLRDRIQHHGLKLMLDFVPNHMGLGHRWVEEHPDFFISGSLTDRDREPPNPTVVETAHGERVLAFGRDPYFAGWPDTLQLDYSNPRLQEALIEILRKIGKQCDGLRCDMAMLVLPEIFERTWGRRPTDFWSAATQRVREDQPGFCFMAEVYWDLEWAMHQHGFDYAYDKCLYDRLRAGNAIQVRDHLRAELSYQQKLARFLENHDEPRAASVFPPDMHAAAAAITFLTPGLRFFHQGQREGFHKRISPHLIRGPEESVDGKIAEIYDRILAILRTPLLGHGGWQLLECRAAWDGNPTHEAMIAFQWNAPGERSLLVVVNYAPHQSQCYVTLPAGHLAGQDWLLIDRLGQATYDRAGDQLAHDGLFIDAGPWQASAFEFTPAESQ